MKNFNIFIRRFAAIFYDTVLVFGVVLAGFTIVYVPLAMYLDNTEIVTPLFFPYLLFLGVGFHIWFWMHGGQTLGMRTWRLKLVRSDGKALSYKDCIIRYLMAVVSIASGGLGFLWILFDSQGRSWHDIVSKTQLDTIAK